MNKFTQSIFLPQKTYEHLNILSMIPPTVQSQVEIIKKATELALRSKESAMKFLVDAKIITQEKPKQNFSVKSN